MSATLSRMDSMIHEMRAQVSEPLSCHIDLINSPFQRACLISYNKLRCARHAVGRPRKPRSTCPYPYSQVKSPLHSDSAFAVYKPR